MRKQKSFKEPRNAGTRNSTALMRLALLASLACSPLDASAQQSYEPQTGYAATDTLMQSTTIQSATTRLPRPGSDGLSPQTASMDNTPTFSPVRKPLTGNVSVTPALGGYANDTAPLGGFVQGGNPLSGNLNARTDLSAPLRGTMSNSAPLSATAGQSTLRSSAAEQMRDHDVCILIDKSTSMLERDCPGDLSRWEWCQQQSRELAQACAQASSNLTVSLFSSDYSIYEHVQPAIIPAIFSANKPWSGTKLGPPLTAILTGYFKERSVNPQTKPLIIAVITDGCPKDMDDVEHVIKDAANNTVKEGEISISFLVIGHDGAAKMEYLDGGLISNGAKRDIVNLIQFDNLKRLGTGQALAMALSGRTFRNAPHSTGSNNNNNNNMFRTQNPNQNPYGGMPPNMNGGVGGLLKALTQ